MLKLRIATLGRRLPLQLRQRLQQRLSCRKASLSNPPMCSMLPQPRQLLRGPQPKEPVLMVKRRGH